MKSSPSPPLAKVKDEPVDEEYEQALISSTSTANTRPCISPSSVHMSCSNCRKNLLKGQTAFQRKGSPALFCSTACLTSSLPSKGGSKLCNNCQKSITRPQDVVLASDTNGTMKEFCGQSCMNSFNYKKQGLSLRPADAPPKTPQTQSLCSMCSRFSTVSSAAAHRTIAGLCSPSDHCGASVEGRDVWSRGIALHSLH
uniref:TRASH domain-containing protein n=1 Tax=Cyprinodon variegatus TaxID=28743 RepID=A0A3Q2CNN8_CYPVA